ncbi:lipid A biosynthesis acyltransferase [Thioalkalivibrio denitrificans]|uniref:Lipid A biosynthesis acyltransferase n=1 Tax=Thioalkalivibrio denitrificans TaxID=108003 RepID=A0A1V3NUK1_9GAMM|nr:lipid A biosynthesis acyltransferase [Thioalkalivibrio denitrificans]OOG28654.1 lipid A biosynthesis acyltransferase [Thioalkalivibrio denitrificans]
MAEARSAPAQAYRAPFHAGLLHPRHWPTWAGLGLVALISVLPRPAVRALARALAALMWRFAPKQRHIAEVNLRLCFPELDEVARADLLRGHFRVTAQCFLDYGMLWFRGPQVHARRIRLSGEAHYRACREAGRPVIMLAPHTPALDFGGLRMSQLYDGVSFAKPMKNPVVEWINHRSRTQYSGDIFAREQGLRPALRHIRNGRFFYYLPDEDLGPEHSVFAPFFGVPKATLPALGRLAKLTGAAVLPSFSIYLPEEDIYELRLEAPMPDFPTGDPVEDAGRMNAAIEAAIRRHPEQYLWTLRFFKTRPAGEKRVY